MSSLTMRSVVKWAASNESHANGLESGPCFPVTEVQAGRWVGFISEENEKLPFSSAKITYIETGKYSSWSSYRLYD